MANQLTVDLTDNHLRLEINFGGIQIGENREVYDGVCEVTPKAYESTVLSTAEKVLESDIVVLEIPNYTVSNQNGNTFIVG